MKRGRRQFVKGSSLLNRAIVKTIAASTAFLAHTGWAAEQWQTSTVKAVYPLANGAFVLILDSDAPQCSAGGPGKHMYATVGQNGLTDEGSKRIYSAALAALLSGASIGLAFDDSSSYCYISRIYVNAP